MAFGSQRWIKVALVASLSINLLVVGVIAGAYLRNPETAGAPPSPPGMRQLTDGLPIEQKDMLRANLRNTVGTQRQSPRARAAAGRAFQAALLSEPFNRAAAEAVLTAQRDQIDKVFVASQSALLDILERMTVDERRAYAAQLSEQRQRPGRDRPQRQNGQTPRDGGDNRPPRE